MSTILNHICDNIFNGKMTYPDGEVVHYGYNRGGMLEKVYGQVKVPISVTRDTMQRLETGRQADGVTRDGSVPWISPDPGPGEQPTVTYTYNYIDSIAYNEFELKSEVFYGNGTHAQYTYDSLQRLSNLSCRNPRGIEKLQDISYSYDSVSNITHIYNAAGGVGGLGGRYEGHYTYDNLYRLVAANGYWKNNRDSLPFSNEMSYTANGRITRKATNARILNGNHCHTKSSDFQYSYAGGGNKVSAITDGTYLSGGTTLGFRWDNCGNLLSMEVSSNLKGQNMLRTHTWTEDNRLQTVADNSHFSCYQYDARGDRTYKLTWDGKVHTVNGRREVYYTPQSATLYASPYLVATPQGYTKHYYAGAERITSQLERGRFADVGTPVVGDSLVQAKLQAVTGNVRYPVTLTAPSSSYFSYLDTLTNKHNATSTLYFYHSDHLGSSSWITYSDGSAVQHLHYLPFGEDFVNKKSSSFEGARYTFSAKEKDAETRYSYFGSRYYNSNLSIWLSVDPMAGKYPSFSPYVYCANNPIKLVDPNGEEIEVSNTNIKLHILEEPPKKELSFREKVELADKKATEVGIAFAEGLAVSLPIISTVNDIHILTKDENIFGDKATKNDKNWAKIGIATLGIGSMAKGVGKVAKNTLETTGKIFDFISSALNVRSGIITTVNKLNENEKDKIEKK